MKMKKLVLVLVSTVFVLGGAASSQEPTERAPSPLEAPIDKIKIPCPVPMTISQTAPPPVAATPFAPDFTLPPGAVVEPNFGGTTPNRHFWHTFRWKPLTECCQYLSGKLALKYKAIIGGGSPTSPDAGNDTWHIMKGGTSMASGPLYVSFPFQAGQTGTKTIPLTPAMLAGDRLSFAVQDDTSVTSATLHVVACCVKK